MAERSIEERVTILEQTVELLEQIPSEMRELKTGVHGLTVRVNDLTVRVDDLTVRVDGVRVEVADFGTEFLQFRDEIRDAFSAVASRSELSSFATRTELYQVRDAVMAQSRALHEDLVDKIKVLGEHRNGKTSG